MHATGITNGRNTSLFSFHNLCSLNGQDACCFVIRKKSLEKQKMILGHLDTLTGANLFNKVNRVSALK